AHLLTKKRYCIVIKRRACKSFQMFTIAGESEGIGHFQLTRGRSYPIPGSVSFGFAEKRLLEIDAHLSCQKIRVRPLLTFPVEAAVTKTSCKTASNGEQPES